MPKLTLQLSNQYTDLYNSLQVSGHQAELNSIIKKAGDNRQRYQQVSDLTKVPWYFIALIHNMESSGSFSGHLHNGDPLTAKTVQVPPGRPKVGTPPFTWEESALDALTYEGFVNNIGWSLPAMLWRLEKYNGFGYRNRTTIKSPYLWSYSQHYVKGKFKSDGVFDPELVSRQAGAAVILKQLAANAALNISFEAKPEQAFPDLFAVRLNTAVVNPVAIKLQQLLNSFGYSLNPDGKAGTITSDAVFAFTGKYLLGDARRI